MKTAKDFEKAAETYAELMHGYSPLFELDRIATADTFLEGCKYASKSISLLQEQLRLSEENNKVLLEKLKALNTYKV
jgi:hypothetical protein